MKLQIYKDFKKLTNNQSGIALMMVLSAIVILTAIMADFSFETHINKLKGYNIEDKTQARLAAESGLNFGMTRLRLYKEAFNYLEKNDGAKNLVKQELINSIWNFPFVYPIPITDKMNQIQKDSIQKFAEENLLEGSMRLTIKNLSNQINLNLIRVTELKLERKKEKEQKGEFVNSQEEAPQYDTEGQLFKTLDDIIKTKSEADDLFASKYLGLDVNTLTNNLKYYLSEEEVLDASSINPGDFEDIPLAIKAAPMSSFSEMHLLPGWDDELVDLIRNEFTVHGAMMIDLNKITDKILKILIPDINEQEIIDFFKYRDDPENPHYFNSLEDFKKYVTSIANLMPSEDFDNRMQKFKAEGLEFGPSPSLFEITAVGEKGRSTYTITAYVVLPVQPARHKLPEGTPPPGYEGGEFPDDGESPTPPAPNPPLTDGEDPNKEKKQTTQLLEPRIVELFIN